MANPSTLSADGASGSLVCGSTLIQMEADGSFGGGTLTPQKKSHLGNWITYGASTLTAPGAIVINVRFGDEVRFNLSGSTTPSIGINIQPIVS